LSIPGAHILPPIYAFRQLLAPPARAPGHGVRRGEPSLLPGLNDLLQISGDKWNHLYAIGLDDGLHGPGNRPAYQDADFQFRQPRRFLARQVARHTGPILADDLPGFDFYQLNPPGDIKHRSNTFVPGSKCCFDHKFHRQTGLMDQECGNGHYLQQHMACQDSNSRL
jgi:hypothetical protein